MDIENIVNAILATERATANLDYIYMDEVSKFGMIAESVKCEPLPTLPNGVTPLQKRGRNKPNKRPFRQVGKMGNYRGSR